VAGNTANVGGSVSKASSSTAAKGGSGREVFLPAPSSLTGAETGEGVNGAVMLIGELSVVGLLKSIELL
jgi:hypothetical protein